MKILFVLGPFPLLSETFILNQITGLIDRGHEVRIYTTRRAADGFHADVDKYDLFKRTLFRRQVPKGRVQNFLGGFHLACAVGLSNPAVVLRALSWVKFDKLPPGMTIFYDLKSLGSPALFDIIHCHFGFHGNRGMLLREIGALKGKLVTTFHGSDITVYLNNAGRELYNKLFTRGDLFLPISQRWRRRLIELGCDDTKIQVHHMGIDCQRFGFKPRLPQPNGLFKIASVARLVEKKGLEFGIEAVARLKKEGTDIEYTIIGDGPLREDLTDLVNRLDVQDCVHMLGWQDQHRVVEILEKSHIFLAPSVTAANGDQEGIPVVLMEAMAMGLPVVSTLHSGIPELVKDGVSGYLVPEKDVESLYTKLKYLTQNSGRWVEMGRHGRKIVEEQYDINVLNDHLVEMYRSLLAGDRR